MRTNRIVWNTQRYPYYSFAARSFTHHLHYPSFVGVTDRKSLAFGAISVSLSKCCHHLDSLTGSLRALQGNIYQRAIIKHTGGIHHLMTSPESGFTDRHLVFIDIAYHVISFRRFRYFAMIFLCVPVINLTHLSLNMFPCRKMAKTDEHSVIIRVISRKHRTVGTCILAYDEVRTCLCINICRQH